MPADWAYLDGDVLLRCVLRYADTRDVGNFLCACDAWRLLGRRKEVWGALLQRHGWQLRHDPDEETSDGDMPETMSAFSALARSPGASALRESNGAEASSDSEAEDGEDARTARLRRRFLARWRRWLPFARAMVVDLDSFLYAARPFCAKHGIAAERARRKLRACAAAAPTPSRLAPFPADRSDDLGQGVGAVGADLEETWDEVSVARLTESIQHLADDDFEELAAPRGVAIETVSTPLPRRDSRLRRVRLTVSVKAALPKVRAALRDLGARRDRWECGLSSASREPLRAAGGKATTLHRRADVVRLDYGGAHVRLARLVERADAGAGRGFNAPRAAYVILEHGPVLAGEPEHCWADLAGPHPRLAPAPRDASTRDLERDFGIVSVEASGFLVAGVPSGAEVCYVVQERVTRDDDEPLPGRGGAAAPPRPEPHWSHPDEQRWRWMLYTRACAMANLRDACEGGPG